MIASMPASGVQPVQSPTAVSSAAGSAANQSSVSTLHAPMAGTFYVAPEPGAQPFVEIGSVVNIGDTICIIESMKMMNDISAESGGCVIEILVGDGEPIATGQALVRIQ
jgi:acetyl-CoA carboxylase biotin carboxyl carrier protein